MSDYTPMEADGFVFFAEPDDMEVAEGLSVVVGAGEGSSGERAFLGIITPHANARALLTAEQLTMLIDWLSGVRDTLAIPAGGAE